MSPRMPPALDFVEQAYVRAVATSRVGFVVIAENVEIFPPFARFWFELSCSLVAEIPTADRLHARLESRRLAGARPATRRLDRRRRAAHLQRHDLRIEE